MEETADVFDNGPAQGFQAVVGGVGGMAFFQGVNGGFPDVPRRDKVRFPDAQGDDVRPARDQIKEFTDAGTGYGAYLLRNFICQFMMFPFLTAEAYGATTRRSVCAGASKMQPFFL